MKRRVLSGWGLLMVLGGAFTAAASPATPETDDRPGVSLWVQPVLALPSAVYSTLGPHELIMVPLGVSLPLGARREVVVEVTPLYESDDCHGSCSTRTLIAAVGTSWFVSSESTRAGFFIQPKLVGVVSRYDSVVHKVGTTLIETSSSRRGQLSLGLDVGYRLPSRRLLLEFMVGGSVGRGWNVSPGEASVISVFRVETPEPRPNRWVWDINPNLLRLGGRF